MFKLLCINFILFLIAQSVLFAQDKKEWTLMFYYLGEEENYKTDMDDSIIENLRNVGEVGSNANVNVVAQVDRGDGSSGMINSFYPDPKYTGALRLELGADNWSIKSKLGEVNSGSPKVLYEFMEWAAKNYPAKHYMLVIKAHGSGLLSWYGPGSTNSENPGAVDPWFTAYDQSNKDCITPFDLEKVLEKFKTELNGGKKLDIFVADTCDPAELEILYQLRNGVDYFVGSESSIIIGNFQFHNALSQIKRDPETTAAKICETIVKDFINDDINNGHDDVMGTFDLNKIEGLATKISELAAILIKIKKETGKPSFKNLKAFYEDIYWDIKKIAESVIDGNVNFEESKYYPEAKKAAAETLQALKETTVSLWFDGDYADAKVGGISILWPKGDKFAKWKPYYKKFDLSKTGKWDEFLEAFYE